MQNFQNYDYKSQITSKSLQEFEEDQRQEKLKEERRINEVEQERILRLERHLLKFDSIIKAGNQIWEAGLHSVFEKLCDSYLKPILLHVGESADHIVVAGSFPASMLSVAFLTYNPLNPIILPFNDIDVYVEKANNGTSKTNKLVRLKQYHHNLRILDNDLDINVIECNNLNQESIVGHENLDINIVGVSITIRPNEPFNVYIAPEMWKFLLEKREILALHNKVLIIYSIHSYLFITILFKIIIS